MAVVKHTEYTV